ncbi:MAG: hypothetical protein ACLGH3_07390 [Actinomycetota bacterium]
MTSGNHELAVSDYQARRAEIDRRSQDQFVLLALNLTIAAAAVEFVSDPRMALFLVPVSAANGLLFADHGRVIDALGRYISDLAQTVPKQEHPIWGWDTDPRRRPPRRWRSLDYFLPLFISLCLPAIGALVITFSEIERAGCAFAAAWFTCLALAVILLVRLGALVFPRGG